MLKSFDPTPLNRALMIGLLLIISPLMCPFGALAAKPPQTELVLAEVLHPVIQEGGIDFQLIKQVIPLNISRKADEDILPSILEHSVQSLLKSEALQENGAIQAVQSAQDVVKSDFVLQPGTDKGVAHHFSFQVLAVQQQALFEYKGYADAHLLYDIETTTFNVLVKNKISSRQEVILRHNQNAAGGNQNIAWLYRF